MLNHIFTLPGIGFRSRNLQGGKPMTPAQPFGISALILTFGVTVGLVRCGYQPSLSD